MELGVGGATRVAPPQSSRLHSGVLGTNWNSHCCQDMPAPISINNLQPHQKKDANFTYNCPQNSSMYQPHFTSLNKQCLLNDGVILCDSSKKTGSRTSENHHPLQQGCHTQEADCVLTCRWSTEDGDASSISSPAAELCHLSSVCTTRLLLRGRGNPSSSTAPQAYTHRESSNRDNVQFTVTRVKQQLLVTHFNFPLAPCHETFTVISSSKTTSTFHSHSFNWFVGYRFILVLQSDLLRYTFAMTQQSQCFVFTVSKFSSIALNTLKVSSAMKCIMV